MTLQQTNMDVSGTLHFEDNSANSGGGISLEDLCVVCWWLYYLLFTVSFIYYAIITYCADLSSERIKDDLH